MTRSQHVVIGYTNRFDEKLHFKVEAYYQFLSKVPVSLQKGNEFFSMLNTGGDNGLWLADSLANTGTGKNYGLEFTAERYFDKAYYFLFTSSLFESKYTGRDGVERHTAFSVGHITNLLAGKEFKLDDEKKKVISLDIKASYLGGRRDIPLNMDSTMKYKEPVPDVSKAYKHRQPNLFRFDFRITYNINLPRATHNLYIAADNLFGARNIISYYWDEKTQNVQSTSQIGLFPYFGYRVHF
jgi:hypothetical protein